MWKEGAGSALPKKPLPTDAGARSWAPDGWHSKGPLFNYSGLDFMLWGEKGALTKTAYAGWTWQASGISKGN